MQSANFKRTFCKRKYILLCVFLKNQFKKTKIHLTESGYSGNI